MAQLTENEARKMYEKWCNSPKGAQYASYRNLLEIMTKKEPTPHVVHYRAGKFWYHRPENFPLLPRQKSASDCTWIVPGTQDWETSGTI